MPGMGAEALTPLVFETALINQRPTRPRMNQIIVSITNGSIYADVHRDTTETYHEPHSVELR